MNTNNANTMINKSAQAIIIELSKNYSSIFKAGVVLFGISLIGLSQTLPILIEYDNKAKELLFLVESQASNEIDKIDCKAIQNKKNQANCKYAKYLLSSTRSSVSLATGIIVFFFYTGVFFIVFSAFGYAHSHFKGGK